MHMRRTAVVVTVALLALSAPAARAAEPATAGLKTADLLELARRFAKFNDKLPEPARLGLERIIAFEEHRHFVCATGEMRSAGGKPVGVRRIIFVKPATFVVDDRFAAGRPGRWLLESPTAAKIDGRVATIGKGDARIVCRVLLPAAAGVRSISQVRGFSRPGRQLVEVTAAGRLVTLLHVGKGPPATCKTAEKDGVVRLTLAAGGRTCELALPDGPGQGTIAVTEGGKKLLPERLLAAGIMPHGPKGVRMIERWDGAYRGKGRAPWDTGRPEAKLVEAVKDGTIKPGRVVVLGCGTGTNAIYLATKGFDVTALDVAPTALTIARRKAAKAKVTVRWLVADVLAPPALKPFDFIFDRGCYHGVRRGNAAGYVKTADTLARPGTLMLILAGNANEPRHYGPPRVDETQLVGDFAKTWDIVHLREVRRAGGPWFWAALLRRRAK